MTQSGATTPGDGNEGVLCISQSSNITGSSLSDFLKFYTGNTLGESYPSAEMQSVHSQPQPNGPLKRAVYDNSSIFAKILVRVFNHCNIKITTDTLENVKLYIKIEISLER